MSWIEQGDVCVITGGTGGLGGQLVRAMRDAGCEVIALDVIIPSDDDDSRVPGATYIRCDVREYAELEQARAEIATKVGKPSILINNAAVRHPLTAIAEVGEAEINDQLEVNLAGPLKATRVFLPDMIMVDRGYIVTVASALSMISPAGFAAYGAAKAGLLGFHESLVHELEGYKGVKTLLVCPGQLDTSMFFDLKTPSDWIAPVVPSSEVAAKIVKRVQQKKTSTLYAPAYVRYLPLMRTLPDYMVRIVRKWAGIDKFYRDAVDAREATNILDDHDNPAKGQPPLDQSGQQESNSTKDGHSLGLLEPVPSMIATEMDTTSLDTFNEKNAAVQSDIHEVTVIESVDSAFPETAGFPKKRKSTMTTEPDARVGTVVGVTASSTLTTNTDVTGTQF